MQKAIATKQGRTVNKALSELIAKRAGIAWTTTGDATGFHVLAARAGDGYTWRTVTWYPGSGYIRPVRSRYCISGRLIPQ